MFKMVCFMVLGLLVLGGLAIFMQNKKEASHQGQRQSFSLVLTALLVAISIILAQFRIYIPLFGFPSVRFSLSEIPIFLVGAMLGGAYGAMAGFASDVISFILTTPGAYHFGFTLNLMLIGCIPGIIFSLIRQGKIVLPFEILNKILGGVALVGALVYINGAGFTELKEAGATLSVAGIPVNVLLSLVMIILVTGLVFVIFKLKKIYAGDKGVFSIDQLIFIVSINYIVVNLLLTPIWLLQLYNIPIMASVAVRIFKSLIDVPLQVIVVYTVIHAIPVRMREKLI